MANLSNTLIAKTCLSPLFDFNNVTKKEGDSISLGEKNKTSLMGRIKKMDQNTRKELNAQLDKALVYVREEKKSQKTSPFYDTALCSMIIDDDDLPVPKVGLLTSLLRTIAHLLGLRISSKDIFEKIVALREELSTGDQSLPVAYDDKKSIEQAVDTTALSQLSDLKTVKDKVLPETIKELKELGQQFKALISNEKWNINCKEMAEYEKEVNDFVDKTADNPSIPYPLKEEITSGVQIVEKYFNKKKDIVKEGLQEKDTRENVVALLQEYVKCIENSALIPKRITDEWKNRLQNIKNSPEKKDTELEVLEGQILVTFQQGYFYSLFSTLEQKLKEYENQINLIESQVKKVKNKKLKSDEEKLKEKKFAIECVNQEINKLSTSKDNSEIFSKALGLAYTQMGLRQFQGPIMKKFFEMLSYLNAMNEPANVRNVEELKNSINLSLVDQLEDEELKKQLTGLKNGGTVDLNDPEYRKGVISHYFSYLQFVFQKELEQVEAELAKASAQRKELQSGKIEWIQQGSGKEEIPEVNASDPQQEVKSQDASVKQNQGTKEIDEQLLPVDKGIPLPIVIPEVNASDPQQVALRHIASDIQSNLGQDKEDIYKKVQNQDVYCNQIYGKLYDLMKEDGFIKDNEILNWGEMVFLGTLKCEGKGITIKKLNEYRIKAIVAVLKSHDGMSNKS